MINFGYHFARARGDALRRLYFATRSLRGPVRVAPRPLAAQVYSYCGAAGLAEQIASIRSFLRHAGRPRRFTVVSDGTISPADRRFLTSIDPCVGVRAVSEFKPAAPAGLQRYLTSHPTGKQLALIMSLPVDEPVIYTDSDVRFFAGAAALPELLAEPGGAPALYLADCQLSADERVLNQKEKQQTPVNTGFLIFFRPLDWTVACDRFLSLPGPPNFFTNQSLTHLVLHANGAAPLDPARFVLQLDDQFVYPDRYAAPSLVLRHYVNPVRHKFWSTFPR